MLQLFEHGDFAVPGRHAQDGSHLAGVRVIVELGAEEWSAFTIPASADAMTSLGAAEITKNEKR